ncbi:hypothetical protein RJ639_045311 [Escallonia herrerae]|uniref:VWFA domain-containing protein n=1 Tax=Escallonia herrerae TaxID=1293975 RepID=A0AA88W9Z3_9ASTE|nr:hypothetical protein RJ639_045311 [Escallonia herrerae]
MASVKSYEDKGRAYVLAGLSSHSHQRATTRGVKAEPIDDDSVDYETPRMASLISKSQNATNSNSKFAVLVGVRAVPLLNKLDDGDDYQLHIHGRAPIDLVLVLDVTESMMGAELAPLKRVVELGPFNRLSIVAFSNNAQRVFSLNMMSDKVHEDETLALGSLTTSGRTNIVEGLKKGVRILEERKHKIPVATFMLLSDGRDSYNNNLVPHNGKSINLHFLSSRPFTWFKRLWLGGLAVFSVWWLSKFSLA